MATIDKIIGVVKYSHYQITTAVVGGDEVTGWSLIDDPYEVGESVESYFNEKYNNAEMRKKH